ncbi:MAG: tRNA-specific adenosine deaminase [Pelagibacteraceae bacterium]|nr:tRNA-specific adenosine deaminase [Pelagibacteraceae bacterium]
MEIAISEAISSQKYSEVPVGAVLVDLQFNKIISKSGNNVVRKKSPIAHAEMLVISSSVKKLNKRYLENTAIYVTLEPCAMCATAISEARISRVYFGAYDEKKGAIENGIRLFANNSYYKPEIYSGILEDKCSHLMKKFFSELRKNK